MKKRLSKKLKIEMNKMKTKCTKANITEIK